MMENWWGIQQMERMKHAEMLEQSKMKRPAKTGAAYISAGIILGSVLFAGLLFAGIF